MSTPILEASRVHAGYGQAEVLRGVDFTVRPGEAIGLMGRNGMGKTTLIRALLGQVRPTAGTVLLDGADAGGLATFQRAARGIAVVPEGRGVFAALTVAENLRMCARPAAGWTEARVLDAFPRLRERLGFKGGRLSGGEQQMLAIGRALMTGPRLLILDEATEGLAPLMRDEIWRVIHTVRDGGMAAVIVDKTVSAVLSLVDRAVVLVKGEVVLDGPPSRLTRDSDLMHRYLGV